MIRRLTVTAWLLLPGVALACPVCGQAGNEAQEWAFLSSTLFLSFAPLIAIFGGATWIWWQLNPPSSPSS